MIKIHNALETLRPGSEWTIRGDEIEWLDETQSQPTDEEVANEIQRLENDFTSNEYQRLRKAEYDTLNQDEMRFDDLKNGTNTWEQAIDDIKAKYPKAN
jgi:hypothetical protein